MNPQRQYPFPGSIHGIRIGRDVLIWQYKEATSRSYDTDSSPALRVNPVSLVCTILILLSLQNLSIRGKMSITFLILLGARVTMHRTRCFPMHVAPNPRR